MLCWVMYDIKNDKIRTKVAKACQEAGIYRVQYSVFLGELNRGQIRELREKIEDLINKNEDSTYIFPMCREDYNQCILLGQAFDEDLITDEIKALFL